MKVLILPDEGAEDIILNALEQQKKHLLDKIHTLDSEIVAIDALLSQGFEDMDCVKPLQAALEKPIVQDPPILVDLEQPKPRFKEVEPFEYKGLKPEKIGKTTLYKDGGFVMASRAGYSSFIWTTLAEIDKMKRMKESDLTDYIIELSSAKKTVLRQLLNDVKDRDMGMFGTVKTDTRPGPEEKVEGALE